MGSLLQHAGSFVAACGLLIAMCSPLSSCGACAPEHVGSVVCRMQALYLRHGGSVVAVHGLSCPVACGILVPQPGIEPASPALEGGFLITGRPGKSPE